MSFSTMKAYTGSVYVNDFNMFNRIYKVYIQAEAPYREHKDNINLFFVKGADGAMIPLTSLGNASYTTGPGSIKRFNMFTAAVIRGSAAQGYSSGQAMEIMENIVREHLPENIDLEWSGLSYQEKQAGGRTGIVMALVFLFVFLFLAAQYESWMVPIAVLLSLPVAAFGAYLGIWICGLENDIYFQIGLVMLMGLAAKNAILIVEFAKEEVDKGGDLVQSAVHAGSTPFSSYPDDLACFCAWYVADGNSKRTGRCKQAGYWYRSILRNDICHRVRYYIGSVLFCIDLQGKK